MRNPIRLKNLSRRFLPFYLAGLAILILHRPDPAAMFVGAIPVVAGAGLRSWGAGHLIKNDRLTISGPYAYLRHPLYAGTLLLTVGFVLVAGGAGVTVAGFERAS